MKKILFLCFVFLSISCDDVIDVEDISDQSVTVLAPSDETVLTITDITFSWNPVEDADTYTLQIATPSFQNALQIVEDTTLTNSSFTKTLELGDYQWRVKAKNVNYETGYSTQSFSIE